MTGVKIVVVVLLSAAIVRAQQIPSGTALPVVLNSTLDVNKVKSGQPISATIAQNVPLHSGAKIRDRSRVNGRVLQAGKNPDGSSYLRLRFDQVHADGRDIAVTTSLRAVQYAEEKGMPSIAECARVELGRLAASEHAYPAGLTPREAEILRLVAAGKMDKEIAYELHITVKTASNHVGTIFRKIGAGNRTEAARYAMQHGLAR